MLAANCYSSLRFQAKDSTFAAFYLCLRNTPMMSTFSRFCLKVTMLFFFTSNTPQPSFICFEPLNLLSERNWTYSLTHTIYLVSCRHMEAVVCFNQSFSRREHFQRQAEERTHLQGSLTVANGSLNSRLIIWTTLVSVLTVIRKCPREILWVIKYT